MVDDDGNERGLEARSAMLALKKSLRLKPSPTIASSFSLHGLEQILTVKRPDLSSQESSPTLPSYFLLHELDQKLTLQDLTIKATV